MEYYNEQETQNHKVIKIKYLNNYKNKSYKHSSTDNIFQNKKGKSLHKIYNKFLVNPYLVRNSRYRNALNNINQTQDNNNRYKNIYDYINRKEEENKEDKKEPIINNINEELNTPLNNNFNHIFPNININKEDNMVNNIKSIRQNFLNETNKNKNQEEYKNYLINNINVNKNDESEFPKIKNNNFNIIERPIEYNINDRNDHNDIYFTNNNNKLSLSYDVKNRKDIRNIIGNQYISPIIAKIAKHNYLMRNPYSYKDEYLGPTSLKNNPILYPISTYKFDFNRYIKNYHVNKFD